MVNRKSNEIVVIGQVIERLADLAGVRNAAVDLAGVLGISAGDFSNRKRRGTLVNLVVRWALENGHSIDYLLTGQRDAAGDAFPAREAGQEDTPSPTVARLLALAREVLESQGIYADSLARNVEAFHRAVAAESPKSLRLIELHCSACGHLSEQPLSRIIDDQPVFCPNCRAALHPDPQIVKRLIDVAQNYRQSFDIPPDVRRDADAESD